MSSFIRNWQRKRLRAKPEYEPKPRPYVLNDDGSYDVLHPTRGWKHFSPLRAAAEFKMGHLLGGGKVRRK